MKPVPTRCPICGGEVLITRLYCHDCDSTIEGRFSGGPFSRLSKEQLDFVERFVRHEGKLTRLEDELGLSYPTIRKTLHEVIRAMGYEPGGADETSGLTDEERQRILEELDKGLITAERAMQLLQES